MGRIGVVAALLALGCAPRAPTGAPCAVDADCPRYQLCEAGAKRCVTGCLGDVDCPPGQRCSVHGRCGDLSGAGDAGPPPPDLRGCGDLTNAADARLDESTGRCYVVFGEMVPWATAEAACRRRGGHLPVITTQTEAEVVRLVAGRRPSWIGLRSLETGPVRLGWIDGTALDFTAWAPGEPDPGGGPAECVLLGAAGWDDVGCGWPATGNLQRAPEQLAAYVCEQSCGDGVVDAGEECDPPGPACTSACRTRRPCDEPGGVVSEGSGHCYFAMGPAVDFQDALDACPAGTHLATLEDPIEDEAGRAAISDESWIALRGGGSNALAWQAGPDRAFNPRLFHGFMPTEPNEPGAACVRVTATGWRDRSCNQRYPVLCERE